MVVKHYKPIDAPEGLEDGKAYAQTDDGEFIELPKSLQNNMSKETKEEKKCKCPDENGYFSNDCENHKPLPHQPEDWAVEFDNMFPKFKDYPNIDIKDFISQKLQQVREEEVEKIWQMVNRKLESYGMPDTKDHFVYVRKVDLLDLLNNLHSK